MMIKEIIKKILSRKLIVLLKKTILRVRYYINRYGHQVSETDMHRLEGYSEIFPTVMSTKQTLDRVIYDKASLCRYGDAEFDISNQENENDTYQKPSPELTKRLQEIITSKPQKNLLVCIPPFNSRTNNIKNFYGKLSFWQWYWLNKFELIKPLLTNSIYGNSFVTRETVFHENDLIYIKQLWDNRCVVFVYSLKGRFETDSILFNNIKEKHNVLIPPVHAFSEYSSILEKCCAFDQDTLFLIAAGPTATVLAFDLTQLGYQALDVGHLPNAYDEYLGEIIAPEEIPLIKS